MQSDAELGFPLFNFIDVIASQFAAIDVLVRDTDEGPGWSQVFDLDRAPDAVLPFLGQMVGVAVDPEIGPDRQRIQIRAESGFDRGTPAAIINSAKRYLTGAQHVDLTERAPDQDGIEQAYQLVVTTYRTETPNPAQVASALLSQKPAGIVLTYTVIGGATYAYMTSHYATYAGFTTAFTTYALATNYVPA